MDAPRVTLEPINAGSVAGEGRYAINGFPLTAARSGGFSSYVYDTVNADEIAITHDFYTRNGLCCFRIARNKRRIQRCRPHHFAKQHAFTFYV